MRLATVLTPITDTNLQLAAQCGVTDLVARYPGRDVSVLREGCAHADRFGLKVTVLEGYLPIENAILGNEQAGEDYDAMRLLFEHMDACDVRLLCYNFMAGTDWVRTRLDAPERGGALVTEFKLTDVSKALSLRDDAVSVEVQPISEAALWTNLQRFLDELLPTAEKYGITLAMHPDDPPLPEFLGRARIMNSLDNYVRLMSLSDSASHGACFCQGTFAEMGEDIPAAIRRLGTRIKYVHFRDVRGTADDFVETFHDNGQTDMVAAMRAYKEIGFDGPMRPDHVPQLVGEEDGPPGYTMLGRLFAYGYMRGLMQSVER